MYDSTVSEKDGIIAVNAKTMDDALDECVKRDPDHLYAPVLDEQHKDFYNASGCADPTAYRAIRNVDYEYRRFQDLLHTIWSVCKVAGFRVEGHITLVDKRTGRVWK